MPKANYFDSGRANFQEQIFPLVVSFCRRSSQMKNKTIVYTTQKGM